MNLKWDADMDKEEVARELKAKESLRSIGYACD